MVAGREEGEEGRTGGVHQEMDGECFEWETCLHSSRSTWVSALHQWSGRHSEDGRDKMRTGGGLSFNEQWSSPVDLHKHSQQSSMDYAFTTGTPPYCSQISMGFTVYLKQERSAREAHAVQWFKLFWQLQMENVHPY